MTDFSDLCGQDASINSLVFALTYGERRLFLSGPPSAVKTMIARRIPTILPPLSEYERRWLQAEWDGTGLPPVVVDEKPYRSWHYASNSESLLGYERGIDRYCSCKICVSAHERRNLPPCPTGNAGVLRLARFGVLFVDQVGLVPIAVLARLREALDRMTGPPLLVVADSPCPCGMLGYTPSTCRCSSGAIQRQTELVSAAYDCLGVRFKIEVIPTPTGTEYPPCESSASIRARIAEHRS